MGKTLRLLYAKELPPPVEQIAEQATFAHKHKKSDGLIDWKRHSAIIERTLRAYTPWPGAFTFLPKRFRKKDTGRLVVGGVEFVKFNAEWSKAEPGTIVALTSKGPVVRTGDTALLLAVVKPEGSRMMPGGSFLQGRQFMVFEDMLVNE